MRTLDKYSPILKAVRDALLGVVAVSLLTIPSLYAAEDTEEDEEDENKVTVTGSRLQRETYTSIAPLQVITADGAREVGIVDAADVIQNAPASTGQQIDLTYSGFVMDNGPGASTANLRGLGSNRSLVLLNGRRLAPAGVEGAPTSPDLNLVPAALVEQYDLLLDGASSVYGSDAVAGVANIILRQDFDGFEFSVFSEIPEQTNGTQTTLSATWGTNLDRGFIGIGAEYVDQEMVRLRDRRWTADCDRNVEVDENGRIRHQDVYYPSQGQTVDPRGCKPTQSLVGRIWAPDPGSIYYTPGFSNGGWLDPMGVWGFSESSTFGLNAIDSDGDGISDVSFFNYSLNGADATQNASLFSESQRLSVMAYGEYTLEGDMNITPYFEAGFNKRDYFTDGGAPQFFPVVPASNPYNFCNPNGFGVDCGLAWDALMNNPAVIAQIMNAYGCDPSTGGSCDQTYGGPIGAQLIQPIVSVMGDRSTVDTSMEQARIVFGFKGDLPNFSFGEMRDWTFDTYFSHTKSTGTSSRMGIRQDRVDQALNVVETAPGSGEYVCADTSNGCVPLNMMAPSLYENLVGDFATQAERDFLFDSRDFETVYKQTIFSGYMNGVLGEISAGEVLAGIGVEYRKDDIASIPDDVARDGLFFGFFSDGGAIGSKNTKEAFAEIEIPLISNISNGDLQELDLNLSTRYTKDEFYGGNMTYSAKVGFRPTESLLIRGTSGTSYRAPNVRENFLRAQTGFNNFFDPCAIPDEANDPFTGYNPANDNREAHVLANCLANGVDPTTLEGNGNNVYSVEIASAGILGLTEEKSESTSFGFVFEQPFSNSFDLTVGVTVFEIVIEDTIIEPSGGYIINDCYNRPSGGSPFCSRITRDEDGYLSYLDAGYLNRDNETFKGIDVNVNFDKTIQMFDYPVEWSADFRASHTREASDTFTDDEGEISYDDDAGEFGYPTWLGQLDISARVGDWRARWQTRYIGSVAQDADFVDDWDDAILGNSDTCYGPYGDTPDVLCRDVGYADSYMNHTVSLYYYGDVWQLGLGIRNVFDDEPPVVDGSEVFAVNNTPIGAGYDLNGRTVYFSARVILQ